MDPKNSPCSCLFLGLSHLEQIMLRAEQEILPGGLKKQPNYGDGVWGLG